MMQRHRFTSGPALIAAILVVAFLVVVAAAPAMARPAAAQISHPALASAFDHPPKAGAPLAFIENVGQFDERARFQVRNGDMALFLTEDALWLSLLKVEARSESAGDLSDSGPPLVRQLNLKLSFEGANRHPQLTPFDRRPQRISFFTGSNSADWRTDVPAWGGVRYVDLYPGIDLEITSQGGRLAQRLIVRNAAFLPDVRLKVAGADDVRVEGDHLRLVTPVGDIALPLLAVEGVAPEFSPSVSQAADGYQIEMPFAPKMSLSAGAAAVNAVNVQYSTFLGGNGEDREYDMTVDASGAVYVTGTTASLDFPSTPGVYDRTNNDNPPGGRITDYTGDVFVTKLSADGGTLLYSTYIGGEHEDVGHGIWVDDAGDAYIAGFTLSANFPTTSGVLDRTLSGGRDAFVLKLSPTGDELLYATYVGGGSWDYGRCIAVDDAGNAYVGGFTHGHFPITAGAAQPYFGGSGDGFVLKLSSEGRSLLYSTYIGGYGWDSVEELAIDSAGSVYLAGNTNSDGLAANLSADGSRFIYRLAIGGSGSDDFQDVVIDDVGNAYLIGRTGSYNFPTTANAFQSYLRGQDDAVVLKLAAGSGHSLYSTYLGGSGIDWGMSIAIDDLGQAYVMGNTASTNFPTVNPLQNAKAGGYDGYLAEVSNDGSALVFSTYWGGRGHENCYDTSNGFGQASIAFGSQDNIILAGTTSSSDFPATANAYDISYNGGVLDIFVTSFHLPSPAQDRVKDWQDDTCVQDDVGNNRVDWKMVRLGQSSRKYTSAFRFQNLDVPQGAIIQQATLSLPYADWGRGWPVSLRVFAEAHGDSLSFADANPLVHVRPRTLTSVAWDISQAPSGWFDSPDLSAVLQEVVDRPDWQRGNALSLILRDHSPDDSAHYLDVKSYDFNPSFAAKLSLVYLLPESTPTPAPVPSPTPTLSPTPSATPTRLPPPSGLRVWMPMMLY